MSVTALPKASRHAKTTLVTALLALAAATPAFAQETITNPAVMRAENATVLSKKVELGIGKSFILELPRDAREVFVANPKVANAVVRSARKLFVIGVADGHTSLFALDAEGRQIAQLEIVIGRDMNVLRKLLKTAMPSATITVSPVGDTIVLTGTVDSAAEAAQAMDIAKGFIGVSAVGGGAVPGGAVVGGTVVEGKVINSLTIKGRDQVMLRVTVAEVKREVIKQLGINALGNWQVGNFRMSGAIDNTFRLNGAQGRPLVSAFNPRTPGSEYANLQAFERAGVLRTLAEPTLTAISGESAKFTAGGEIPIPQSESCTQTQGQAFQTCTIGVTYKPFGVSLVFQPVVLSVGRISMRVSTEVTEIDATNQIRATNLSIPAFRIRKSDTTVELPSGGSMAVAGLIQQSQKQIIGGIPALMNVPVLGALFRSRDYVREETELLIIVTPLISKPVAASDLARPEEGYVDARDPQAAIMGRLNKIYGVAGAPNDGKRYRGHVGFIAD
ncbi:MAG: type II and III secretion system protein family protein [Beijerinckiaceae bacterium]